MFFDKIIDFEEVIYLPIQVSKTHITAKQKSAPRAIHRADHKRERKKQKILSKTFVRPSIYSTWLFDFFAHICFWWLFPQSTKTFLERFVLFFCEKEKKNAFHMNDPNYPWYHDRFSIFNTKINH